MVKEENARQGFLKDECHTKLRNQLPNYLKPLFIAAYVTGVRPGELLAWKWDQVDFDAVSRDHKSQSRISPSNIGTARECPFLVSSARSVTKPCGMRLWVACTCGPSSVPPAESRVPGSTWYQRAPGPTVSADTLSISLL